MEGFIFKTFSVEFFLLISILVTLIYNVATITHNGYNFPLIDNETYIQTLFILFICFLLSCGIDFGGATSLNLFYNDLASISLKPIIIIAVSGALVCGKSYFITKKINLFEYYSIVLLAIFSLLFLSSSTDFISIYLCLEMQSLCFYILASFNRYSVFSTEAGLKYFVLGAFASGLFLFGVSILYGLAGTTNLSQLALLYSEVNYSETSSFFIIFGLIFILVTVFFKLAAAPFHIWSPDVYEGAPLNSTIIFVLVPKLVFLFLIFRIFFSSFAPFLDNLQPIFLGCGILSVMFGSILALQQRRLKKLLIYSSISHVGFMLLAFATGSSLGLIAVFYYILFYIITGFLVWGVCGIYNTFYNNASVYLTDFASLVRTNPAIAGALGLSFFSLAGVPPLVGFSMKFFIFNAAIINNLYELSLVIILLSVIGSFYYLRFIKILFFEKQTNFGLLTIYRSYHDFLYILFSVCFFIIIFGFFNPTFFLLYSYKIVLGIFLI